MGKLKFVKGLCDVDGKLNDIRERLEKYRYDRAVELSSSVRKDDQADLPTPLALAKTTNIVEAVSDETRSRMTLALRHTEK